MTGDKITVLTAAGERLTVPLAKVEFDSKEGKHVELVGVLDKLPVDCLLGRSSFGKTLSRQSILDQWEENALAADAGGQEAFVVTRRQRALEEALLRADELIDRESSIAIKSLYKKKERRNVRVQRKGICKLYLRDRYRKRKVRRIPRMVLW